MNYAEGRAHLSPPVQRADSEETTESDQEKLLRLVDAFVESRYGGDQQQAFNAYAKDGTVDQDGVTRLLTEAGVKDEFGWLKFRFIPGRVMEHFDTSGDGKITPEEFAAGMNASG